MSVFQLFGRCFMCKKRRFIVMRRRLFLKSLNQNITSRESFCTPCIRKVLEAQEEGKLN